MNIQFIKSSSIQPRQTLNRISYFLPVDQREELALDKEIFLDERNLLEEFKKMVNINVKETMLVTI